MVDGSTGLVRGRPEGGRGGGVLEGGGGGLEGGSGELEGGSGGLEGGGGGLKGENRGWSQNEMYVYTIHIEVPTHTCDQSCP